MANWCDTTYICVGELNELQTLYNLIDECKENKRLESDFGNLWLECVIDAMGMDSQKCRCRGEIYDYTLEDDVLNICQETAWGEQEGFRECIEKKFPSVKVYYCEEEPGCGIYHTNDTTGEFFPDNYRFEYNSEIEYYKEISDIAKIVTDIVKYNVEPTNEAVEMAVEKWNEEHDDDDEFIEFHIFTRE